MHNRPFMSESSAMISSGSHWLSNAKEMLSKEQGHLVCTLKQFQQYYRISSPAPFGLINIFIAFTEINPFRIRHLTIQCTYQLLHFGNTNRPLHQADKLDNLQNPSLSKMSLRASTTPPRWMHIANDYKQHIKVLIFFISVQCFRYFTQYFHPPH